MKTWLYLPLLLLGFILPGCTKTTNEVVIPNQTILYEINPSDWKLDNSAGTYYFDIPVPELGGVNQLDGVIVSMARYKTGSTDEPQVFEMLPEVYLNQSYNVLHNDQALTVEIKGVNGAASAVPPTKVRIKIVLVPSAQ